MSHVIPYAEIDTLFLDAGNTLISMDFEWIGHELHRIGLNCTVDSIRRAEAAARPATSKQLSTRASGTDRHLFQISLRRLLSHLDATSELTANEIDTIAGELTPRLKQPGQDHRLWSWLMPGTMDAIEALSALGLKLVVVSNSDGSVERGLTELGLVRHLSAVFDSTIVGYEKPDPRIFDHAIAVSGAARTRTVHVGDMYHYDVLGSRQAGLHSILLDPFDDWDVDDCERCRDLSELAQRFVAARHAGDVLG